MIKHLPEHPETQTYRNLLDNNKLLPSIIDNGFGHSDIHVNQSDSDIMQRILTECNNASIFQTPDEMSFYIEESLYTMMNEILHWKDTAHQHNTQHFIVPFDEEDIVGHGFSQDTRTKMITEYTTNTITIVLQRCNTNQFGFDILTAYPTINSEAEHRIPTNRDLTPVIQQTDAYQKASPMQKAYYEYISNPKNKWNIYGSFNSNTVDDMIQLKAQDEQKRTHQVRIRYRGLDYKMDNKPMRIEMLKQDVPSLYRTIQDLESRIHELKQTSVQEPISARRYEQALNRLHPPHSDTSKCQDEPDIT